ncbi:hypothetical protein JNB91_02020 [Rhizobium wenxiniae]|uniref:hypothetical protein n=1 Tax=Rhizobium wenxiniae TaxID=1737357 RepID=UPI001C6E98E4|nr:hypothetical protein [Rhizobium wenxiniae]MBW9086609.1 hypothetical protein [Rhizobium wenxiniae]
MNSEPSWLATNYHVILGLTPVVIGALLLLAAVVAIVRNQLTVPLLGAVFFGAALCGSAVFSSISWSKDEGKIETIAGALSKAGNAVDDNKRAIKEVRDALDILKTQVNEIALALPATGSSNDPSSAPALDLSIIQENFQKFDGKIKTIDQAIISSGGQLKGLNDTLQTIAPPR